jgi:hypothetical protein
MRHHTYFLILLAFTDPVALCLLQAELTARMIFSTDRGVGRNDELLDMSERNRTLIQEGAFCEEVSRGSRW